MIASGLLREKITFQEPSRTPNGSGGFTTTYADALDTFAKVEEIKSNPDLIAGQENVKQLVKFTIRFRPVINIENGFRAVWRGFNFIVNNIKVDHLRTTIEILAFSEMETSLREIATT